MCFSTISSFGINENVIDAICLAARELFWQPFSSLDGLSNLFAGALKYNLTTSLPGTFPVSVTVRVAVSLPFRLNALRLTEL